MRYFTILFFFYLPLSGFAQEYTLAELKTAVENQSCTELTLPNELDISRAPSELYYLSLCYQQTGQFEQSLKGFDVLEKAEQWNRNDVLFWKATALAEMDKKFEAIAYLQQLPSRYLDVELLENKSFSNVKGISAFEKLKSRYTKGFNFWTFLLTGTAFIGFLLSFFLYIQGHSFTKGNNYLATVILLYSLILFNFILYWTRYESDFPYFRATWNIMMIWIAPLFYFYIRSVFEEALSKRQVSKHILWPIFATIICIPLFLGNFGITISGSRDGFLIVASAYSMLAYLAIYGFLLFQFLNHEWNVDSNIQTWGNYMKWSYASFVFGLFTYYLLAQTSFFSPEWDYAVSFVMSVTILFIGYLAIIQKRVFISEPIGKFLPSEKYRHSQLTDQSSLSLKKSLDRLLKEQEVYRENDLRLDSLATYLDCNTHQVSQVINQFYGKNFFELINSYRVKHVRKILESDDYDHYTIQQIAFESGFNNKVSFNKYFKAAYKLTPSAYRLKTKSEREINT